MIAIPLLAALLLFAPQDTGLAGTPQDSGSTRAPQISGSVSAPHVSVPALPKLTPEQEAQRARLIEEARARHESARQAAIHINDLAATIHSEADARALVDAVAEQLTGHRRLPWTTRSIRHRVARAEFEAVSDPSRLIPEQRVVDVWNEYVREIDAPEEALITVAELHNLRDSMYVGASHFGWKHDMAQSIWTMPNIYALAPDGKVADGCRALEALKIVHDMHEMFMNVRAARECTQKGTLISDVVKQREQNPVPVPAPVVRGQLQVGNQNPIRTAAFHYQQEHGAGAYRHLLRRLFAELFPAG